MHIHHLNCGSHCPFGGALFDGTSKGLFADIRTHVLLLETERGLVLVDTGYGRQDVLGRPRRRLAWTWPLLLNVRLREEDTAIHQIEQLGFSARDVRHIILTHMDFDHAGGLEDFPEAQVHVLADEKAAADKRQRSFVGGQRYRRADWDQVRQWHTYEATGESWNGFDAVRELAGLPPEILLLQLRGHTLGHAGIAISGRDGWLLHAGDAFMHQSQIGDRPHMPPGLKLYERIMMSDPAAGQRNLERLRGLHREASNIRIFCAHDTQTLISMAGHAHHHHAHHMGGV